MRDYFPIDHLPDRTIRVEGEEYLFFSGTSYLGLGRNPTFLALLAEGQQQYGGVFGSSRNGNLRLCIYEEAEAELARFTGAPAALTLSSGMMAGQAVVNWLKSSGLEFVYGPSAHPAIWQSPTVRLPQLSFDEWTTRLPSVLRAAPTRQVVVAVNSLDAVQSVTYPFDWVRDLPAEKEITLLVDDSHGLGVIGPGGTGIRSLIPQQPNVRLIVTASLAKAMGMPGGAIFADEATLNAIRHTAFFGACSPLPPAYLYAFNRARAIYQAAFQRLQQNIQQFEAAIEPLKEFQHIPAYPVFYTPQDDLYPFLLTKRILIYSFAYPAPTDKPNTRLVINALHEPEDLTYLAQCLHEQKLSQFR